MEANDEEALYEKRLATIFLVDDENDLQVCYLLQKPPPTFYFAVHKETCAPVIEGAYSRQRVKA